MRRFQRPSTLILAIVLLASACGGSDPGGDSDATTAAESATPTTSTASVTTKPLPASMDERCSLDVEADFAAIPAQDGSTLTVAGFGPPDADTAVVLLPQINGGLCGWVPFAQVAAGQGIRAIAVDPCGFGASTCTSAYWREIQQQSSDVLAWVRAEHQADRVVLAGASAGGANALATGQDAGADTIIDLSGPADWREVVPASEAAAAVTVPLLIVCADSDAASRPEDLRAALEASPADPKRYLAAPKGHGWSMLTEGAPDAALTEVGETVLAWIEGDYR